jgi:hypothetical protein
MVSQLLQTRWTTSFRPTYKYKGKYVFVSSALLAAITISLSRAHAAFTIDVDSNAYDNKDNWMYFLLMTLHFDWTTAASLVNYWNVVLRL